MWVRINYLARLRGDEGTRQAATARLADVFLIVFGAMKLRCSGGMSYTRVWIHREVLDSKIHSVLVLGVLIGSVSNNTNTEYRQSYSLICIWMKIHQTESFAYLCEFICPPLRLCVLARASTNTLSDIYTFSFAFIVQLVSTKEKDNLAVLQAFRPACRKPLSLYEHPSVWLCASDLFGRSEHLLG